MKNKINISIFGSCVSREIFNVDENNEYKINTYINFNSIFSQCSPRVCEVPLEWIQHKSNWYNRVIYSDINKKAFELLKQDKSDYLILDLMSERLSLLKVKYNQQETLITGHNDLKNTNLFGYNGIFGNLEDAEHISLEELNESFIEESINLFCDKIKQIFTPDKIIFIESYYVYKYVDKNGIVQKFNMKIDYINKINSRLVKLQNIILENLKGCHIVRFPNNIYGDESHHLNLSPTHYDKNYYKYALNEIKKYIINNTNNKTEDLINVKLLIIEENILIIKIEKKIDLDIDWAVNIKNYGDILKHYDFTNENILTYTCENPGRYVVQVLARLRKKNCEVLLYEAIDYHPEKFKKDFKAFVAQNNVVKNNIKLYNLEYPYQNLLLITCNKENDIIIKNLKNNISNISSKLRLTEYNNFKDYSVNILHQFDNFNNMFFSGKTIYKNNFIFGQSDIKTTDNFFELCDQTGIYTAIFEQDNKIIITNDYFGQYRLFSYTNKDINIISNNYHLIIIILKILGLKLTFDYDHTLPYFLTAERMLLEQSMSYQTDIKEIRQLKIDEYYYIDCKGGHYDKKSINKVFIQDKTITEKEYKELIKKSAYEIKNNVEVILKDSRFTNIICDVTGGKDSRLVLAAITNFNKILCEKIYINSKDVTSTSDKKIFIGLNKLYNFKYNDLPEQLRSVYYTEKSNAYRSFFMGTTYSRPASWNFLPANSDSKSIVHLTGAGEAFYRPLFPAYYPHITYDGDENDLADQISSCFNNGIIDLKKVSEQFKIQLLSALNDVPGDTLYERFNYLYLCFRNTYHFGTQALLDCQQSNFIQWQPLQSKTAFNVLYKVLDDFRSIKFQIDLLAELNPVLVSIPFESQEDNNKVKELIDKIVIEEKFKALNIKLDEDDSDWKNANMRKKSNITIINKKDIEKNEIFNKNMTLDLYNEMMQSFKKMCNYNKQIYCDKIGIELYAYLVYLKKYINCKTPPRSMQFMYNKILSVTDQLDLLNDNL